MSAGVATRLPAAERRSAIVDAALRVFSEGSYAGATTAQIARAAGVSEPILYRHFASKRELYFACLEAAWARLRARLDARISELGHEEAYRSLSPPEIRELKSVLPALWMQAITEAGEDPDIRRHVRRHMRQAHAFFAAFVSGLQDAGVVQRERRPDAEAWVIVGGLLLIGVADRLGGLVSTDDLAAIHNERRRWLTGAA